MTATHLAAAPQRHPWLDALAAAPGDQIQALIRRRARIPPYGRAEPDDAAASLLFGLPDDDLALPAFDAGCREVLERLHATLRTTADEEHDRAAVLVNRLLAVIRRTRPAATVRDLHARYVHWFGAFETAVIDTGLDLRREYWRTLALTQDMAGDGLEPRRLMPLWFEVCAEAGARGRYDDLYLDVGLIGLRRLPLGKDVDSNEEAVCHGIARWAVRQRPDKKTFLARWYEIEAAYPRSPDYWPPLVADVIAAQEDALYQESEVPGATFPAAAWWRDALDLPQPSPGKRAEESGRRRAIEPPPPESLKDVLRAVENPLAQIRPWIDRLVAGHRRYAEATGDVFYLVRTACNVGMRLIEGAKAEKAARGALSASLARLALEYAPADVFAWALWRDGLAVQGALTAAETVGWEAVRRFPENPQWPTQLATLLLEGLGRPAEAERLLWETIERFPDHAPARAQLAKILASFPGREDEAVAVLREAMAHLPDNPHTYNQLAALLADHYGDSPGALSVLDALLEREPGDAVARTLRARISRGERVSPAREKKPGGGRPTAEGSDTADIHFPAARLRRALFLVESTADSGRVEALAEVRRALDQDPGLAYARYVAERAGLTSGGNSFALAFERAIKNGKPEDFQTLADRARGIDAHIARAGLVLITGGAAIPIPAASDEADAGAFVRRFAVLAGGINEALARPGTDHRPLLRLVSDFAASELSIAA